MISWLRLSRSSTFVWSFWARGQCLVKGWLGRLALLAFVSTGRERHLAAATKPSPPKFISKVRFDTVFDILRKFCSFCVFFRYFRYNSAQCVLSSDTIEILLRKISCVSCVFHYAHPVISDTAWAKNSIDVIFKFSTKNRLQILEKIFWTLFINFMMNLQKNLWKNFGSFDLPRRSITILYN